MRDDSYDLDECSTCVDCDDIVNELQKILRRCGDITVPEELRRANEQLGSSLATWLAVHRREKEHPRRRQDGAESAPVGGRTFDVSA